MANHIHPASDFYTEACAGSLTENTATYSIVGKSRTVGVTFAPIAIGGVFQTPQVGDATTLRIKAGGNASDTAAGSGARSIQLTGISPTGEMITETLVTAGASASATTSQTFIRLLGIKVVDSGTYSSPGGGGSHAAAITIENGAGGTDWGTIDATEYPTGNAQIGGFTIPAGKVGYLYDIRANVDSNKLANLVFVRREEILATAAPYCPAYQFLALTAVENNNRITQKFPIGPIPELTDLLVFGKLDVGTGIIEVSYEVLLRNAR